MKKRTVALMAVCIWLCACGGRLPTQSKTHAIIHKHFRQYGKKYPDSVFGGKKVLDVEVLKIEEIHKHLIAVQTFITIEGPEVFKVRMLIEKGPLGWRYLAWENLSGG